MDSSYLAAHPRRAFLDTFAQEMSGGEFKLYSHVTKLAMFVQEELEKGGARILISLPPRHGKSELFSRWLPCWFLEKNPTSRVILTSYESTIAQRFSVMARDFFESDATDTVAEVRPDRRAAFEWYTKQGGMFRTAGVGGPITSLGYDLGIIDDFFKNWAEASSKTYRDKVYEWYYSTFESRAEPGASILGIATRWNCDDLFGRLEEDSPDKWTIINAPAIADQPDDWFGRKEGEALCPERYSAEELLEKKKHTPASIWASLYDGRPAPLEGAIIKVDQLRTYTETPRFQQISQSWDCGFTATGKSYSVGQVWGRREGEFYLLDQFRKRCEFDEIVSAAIEFQRIYKTNKILVERAASGFAVIQQLEKKFGERAIVRVPPMGAKGARLQAVQPLFSNGQVFIPSEENAPWVDEWIKELTLMSEAGSGTGNDDQVDATSQGLHWLSTNRDRATSASLKVSQAGLYNEDTWGF